jgi:tRNA1(Val) A37 N6-methylase TrmN6
MMTEAPPITAGSLLGGQVAYCQPLAGYRTGIEPVLLAAAVPARPGDCVVEAGTGAGAGLLALAARVGGLHGVGLERDTGLAAIAAGNLAANGHHFIRVLAQDVTLWRPPESYDHAFANPPWHAEASTPSPLPGRRQAKIAAGDVLARWTMALARGLRQRGSLSLILPASSLSEGIAALVAAECAEITVQPFWPRTGQPAKLMILRGIRCGRGASRLLPGLILHQDDGSYTPEAERILRQGAALIL